MRAHLAALSLFALVGCLPLPVNRGVAAMLVPEVENLLDFIYDRPAMTPTTATECQIANAADAALQSQWRLRRNPVRQARLKARSKQLIQGSTIPGCYAMTFTPTPWASQQKSRVATIHVPPGKDDLLAHLARSLAAYEIPTEIRILEQIPRTTSGKGDLRAIAELFAADVDPVAPRPADGGRAGGRA